MGIEGGLRSKQVGEVPFSAKGRQTDQNVPPHGELVTPVRYGSGVAHCGEQSEETLGQFYKWGEGLIYAA
jgi:hypothetical protein